MPDNARRCPTMPDDAWQCLTMPVADLPQSATESLTEFRCWRSSLAITPRCSPVAQRCAKRCPLRWSCCNDPPPCQRCSLGWSRTAGRPCRCERKCRRWAEWSRTAAASRNPPNRRSGWTARWPAYAPSLILFAWSPRSPWWPRCRRSWRMRSTRRCLRLRPLRGKDNGLDKRTIREMFEVLSRFLSIRQLYRTALDCSLSNSSLSDSFQIAFNWRALSNVSS